MNEEQDVERESQNQDLGEQGADRPNTVQEPIERPVIFSGEMVRAILEDRKTQTRRVVKPQPVGGDTIIHHWGGFHVGRMRDSENAWRKIVCPYGVAGDWLWVREKHCIWHRANNVERGVYYWAGANEGVVLRNAGRSNWRPSIHMPRWASRITLEITKVRVERLRDIRGEDCLAEGILYDPDDHEIGPCGADADLNLIERFRILWDSLHGKGAWKLNPWVWVLEFKRSVPSAEQEGSEVR